MFSDAGQHIGEPGLGVDIVHLGGDDQAIDDGGAGSAAIRTGEQPGLSAQGDASKRPFRRIVGQADSSVFEEAGK